MLFRQLMTEGYTTGTRGSRLSKQSLSLIDNVSSYVVLIDMTYLSLILETKSKSKKSKIYGCLTPATITLFNTDSSFLTIKEKRLVYEIRHVILTAIKNLISLIKPSRTILVYGSREHILTSEHSEPLVKLILEPLKMESVTLTSDKFVDYCYTFTSSDMNTDENKTAYLYVTNSFSAWSICSDPLRQGCVAFVKNLRPVIYFSKFGLYILARLIKSSRIINRLGLDTKACCLQYLYFLLLGVKFFNQKKNTDYFFDDKYFKWEKGWGWGKFGRSNGKALDLIKETHKFMSPIFLERPDLRNQFLFYSTDTFILSAKHIKNVSNFEISLLSRMSAIYQEDRLRIVAEHTMTHLPAETPESVNKTILFYSQYEPIIKLLENKTGQNTKPYSQVSAARGVDDNRVGATTVANILRSLLW